MSKTPKKSPNARKRRWSAKVTKHSDALDLERDVFKSKDPHKIAVSLNGPLNGAPGATAPLVNPRCRC